MGVRLGDYLFSDTDARRTVAGAAAMLDGYGEHDPSAMRALAARRRRIAGLIGRVDGWNSDFREVAAVLPGVWAELAAARDDLEEQGLLPDRATGTVAALHLGDGGVPKVAVESIDIDHAGVIGDRQATRRHHGAPWQALCLWSEEVIAAFAAGGHPIGPGMAGENVTIAGLRWGDVRPGARLRIGTTLCEVSSYAVPCRKNAGWFSDRDVDRIHHRHGPVSRMYATVLEPGSCTVGDAAVLEPASCSGDAAVLEP